MRGRLTEAQERALEELRRWRGHWTPAFNLGVHSSTLCALRRRGLAVSRLREPGGSAIYHEWKLKEDINAKT